MSVDVIVHMTSFIHLSFVFQAICISNSIELRNLILGTNTQQHNAHLMIKMKVTLTDYEGHRLEVKVTTQGQRSQT